MECFENPFSNNALVIKNIGFFTNDATVSLLFYFLSYVREEIIVEFT